MSIIHEALKKVQQSPITTSPAQPPLKTSPATSRLLLALAGMLVALLIPSCLLQGKNTNKANWLHSVRPVLPGQTLACTQLKLEGILETEGRRIALINGNIYEEGQTAGTCTITTIHAQTVTISDGKKELDLSVSVRK
jgi:hypothetical protein